MLTKDALFLIIRLLHPTSVLSLFQVNRHLAQISRDQKMFHRLLNVHYAFSSSTKEESKRLYMIITGEIGMKYSVGISRTFTDIMVVNISQKARADEYVLLPVWENTQGSHKLAAKLGFKVTGTKIKRNEKIWLVIYTPTYRMSNIVRVEVYFSKEKALDNVPFAQGQELEDLRNFLQDEYFYDIQHSRIDPSVSFAAYIKERGLPPLYDEREIRRYIEKEGCFGTIPGELIQKKFIQSEWVRYMSLTIMVCEVTLE
jgi:hypothetical protein